MALANLVGLDTNARGDGSVGKGKNGYTYVNPSSGVTSSPGANLSFSWANFSGATYTSADTARYLLLVDGVTRDPRALVSGVGITLSLTIGASDSAWRVASFYGFSNAAITGISCRVVDSGTSAVLVPAFTLPDYQAGIWIRIAFQGNIRVEFTPTTTGGGMTGCFVDPYVSSFAGAPPSNAVGNFAG